MKKIAAILTVAAFAAWMTAILPVFAAEETAQTDVVDVGNKICPVSGQPVSGVDFVTYEGKRYGLCCPACRDTFLNDPYKYITKLDEMENPPAGGSVQSEEMSNMKSSGPDDGEPATASIDEGMSKENKPSAPDNGEPATASMDEGKLGDKEIW